MGAAGEMALGAKPDDVSPWDSPHDAQFGSLTSIPVPSPVNKQVSIEKKSVTAQWEWLIRSSALCIVEGQDSIRSGNG